MNKYKVLDCRKVESIQEADNEDDAIQKHLLEFGLLGLPERPKVVMLVENIDG